MVATLIGANSRPVWYDILIGWLPGPEHGSSRLLIKARDITEKKASDDHIQLIVRELSHRAKNLLAVITAMARSATAQSLSLAQFEDVFSSRIRGLARSHDLLVQQEWAGASFYNLVRQHLGPFTDICGNRFALSGVDITLPPALTQVIGMAMHELATNAVKHGALANETGHICVTCTEIADGYEIKWVEAGGPEVHEPQRSGFGRVVVEEMVSETFGCDARLEFRRSGVTWFASLRRDAIDPDIEIRAPFGGRLQIAV